MSEDKEQEVQEDGMDGASALMTEAEREALLDEWSNTPSPNPFYRGKTPAEVARLLFVGKRPAP